MAIFYLGIKTFGRSRGKNGSRATSAAAYRSGERIRDERTGNVYDHSRRSDVIHKEIVLPSHLAAQRDSLAWARNRAMLWNAAEHAEMRRDSRVAREFVLALPHELAPAARTQLAVQFATNIADRYRSAVDVAIHAPRGDARNFHAHLLATTREVTPDGLGSKTTLELSGTRRHELGLPRWREEIARLREDWAGYTNAALERAHVATRVTHLTRAERGLFASDAPPRVPLAAYHMERRGARSFIAEKIRERHRAGLERTKTEPGRQARGRSESEQPLSRQERTLMATGRSMVRQLGVGVRSAWSGLQQRFGRDLAAETKVAPAVESRSRPMLTGEGSVAAVVRNPERSQQTASRTELGIGPTGRSERIDQAVQSVRNWLAYREKHRDSGIDQAAQSARNWFAYREKQQAREAVGLNGIDGSGRDAPGKSRDGKRSRGEELEPNHERERSRGRGNDFSL